MTLEQFFGEHPTGALAFSGGTDSSLLVWAAKKYGKNWRAYFVSSAFQPAFELADAKKVAEACEMPLTVLPVDIFACPEVIENPENRCYHCKRRVFSRILEQAQSDGYSLVIDGTNASDDAADRPGMRALRELSVRSPLRECGLTKGEVRELAREAGLFIWSKPSYACLATRVPAGTAITAEALAKAERGEAALARLGFVNFRLRVCGAIALLQFTEDQFAYALQRREEIRSLLREDFATVALDLLPRNRAQS